MRHHSHVFSHSKEQHHELDSHQAVHDHNHHLLLQIKMYVIVLVGGVIIAICLVYIVHQCRGSRHPKGLQLKQTQNRRPTGDDAGTLREPKETMETLLPAAEKKTVIALMTRKDREFYV